MKSRYHQLEEFVFNKLWDEYKETGNTFSVRLKASEGAGKDYFIGKEQSGYLAFTYWNIPTPIRNPIDVANFFFALDETYYYFSFQFICQKNDADPNLKTCVKLGQIFRESLDDLQSKYEIRTSKPESKDFLIRVIEKKGFLDFESIWNDFVQFKTLVSEKFNYSIEAVRKIDSEFVAEPFNKEVFVKNISNLRKRLGITENEASMTIWKLGCNWGSAKPSFYQLIKSKNIVIGVNDKLYQKGDLILVTEGHTVCAIAQILDAPQTVTNDKELQEQFIQYQIEYSDYVTYAKAEWMELNDWQKFKYELQQGICKVNKKEVTEKVIELWNNRDKNAPFSTNFLTKNHPLNQILYGPPGTGKTYSTVARAYEIAKGIKVTNENYTTAKTWFKSELVKEEDRQLDFITFHQNYSYEDFVMGLKPDLRGEGLGFSEHRGVFFEICQRALTNLKDSQKPIQDIRQEKSFDEILELFKNKVLDQIESDKDGQYKITESVYIDEVTEDAFYYTGNNWNVGKRRMKFEDIKKIYNSGFTSRQEAKKTPDISGLAREHISYYFKIAVELREFAQTKEKEITIQTVERVVLKNYILVIDEINRANISRVFGELITLIEDDKRWGNENEMEVRLPDGKTKFTVPKNLHIIGTMNTADKSIALLDIALRRRFEFISLFPNKEKVVIEYQDFFEALNNAIKHKKGVDFMIGHAYFMSKGNQAFDFKSAMNKKVIPLLNEYFYNPRSTDDVKKIINEAIEVLNKTSSTNKYEVREENYQLIITEKNAGN